MSRALAKRALRRSSGMVALVGDWWLGVVKITSARSGNASGGSPSLSTGTAVR